MTAQEKQVERRRQTAIEQAKVQNLIPGYHGAWWAEEEVALLGTMADEEVAPRTV